jgi:RNA polymerase sigma-70 factor (ECF subfamily)
MRCVRPPGPADRDAELLRRSDYEPAAFSELYARHVSAVYGWVAGRSRAAAADLTAETFARAWLHRRRFRDEHGGSALPWLLGIAAHLVADLARHDRIENRARRRLGLPLELSVEDGYGEVERRLSPSRALLAQLQSLAPHERRAIELRVVDELSYDEVADRLSIRPAAARLRVSRALRRLAATVPREEV